MRQASVGLLGAILTFAVDRDLVAFSPVRGIKRYRDQRNQMYLGLDGLRQLGRVLSELEMEGSCIIGIDCLRLLAMTGARKSEITKLMWSEVDLEHAGCASSIPRPVPRPSRLGALRWN